MAPIHRAADGDMAELNRLLAEDPGHLNAEDGGGRTPLMYVAFGGHDAVMERLLALGAGVELADAYGCRATHYACFHDHAWTLALLLDAGPSLNARDRDGDSPLILAVRFGRECVHVLIARGKDVLELNAQNHNGYTALHLAAQHGHSEIVQLLLEAGADPTTRNNEGRTPLDLANTYIRQPAIALLEAALVEPQRPAACSTPAPSSSTLPRPPAL